MINSGRFDGTFTPGDWKKLSAKERLPSETLE
jgi:hypothetical protein